MKTEQILQISSGDLSLNFDQLNLITDKTTMFNGIQPTGLHIGKNNKVVIQFLVCSKQKRA